MVICIGVIKIIMTFFKIINKKPSDTVTFDFMPIKLCETTAKLNLSDVSSIKNLFVPFAKFI